MSDLFLNKNFEIEIGSSGDLKTVSREERVRQSIVVHVTNSMYDEIGEASNVKKKLHLAVKRALKTHSLIERTESVDVSRSGAGKYNVSISYGMNSMDFKVDV
jgi:hypothetical protein